MGTGNPPAMAFVDLCVKIPSFDKIFTGIAVMTKISARLVLLSCVMAAASMLPATAQAQQTQVTVTTSGTNSDAAKAATSAATTAATTAGSQAAGLAMTPPPAATPPTAAPIAAAMAQQQQQNVIMEYNKRQKESMFYGVDLPPRLFNNVNSNW